jgi:hypothetical protein
MIQADQDFCDKPEAYRSADKTDFIPRGIQLDRELPLGVRRAFEDIRNQFKLTSTATSRTTACGRKPAFILNARGSTTAANQPSASD